MPHLLVSVGLRGDPYHGTICNVEACGPNTQDTFKAIEETLRTTGANVRQITMVRGTAFQFSVAEMSSGGVVAQLRTDRLYLQLCDACEHSGWSLCSSTGDSKPGAASTHLLLFSRPLSEDDLAAAAAFREARKDARRLPQPRAVVRSQSVLAAHSQQRDSGTACDLTTPLESEDEVHGDTPAEPEAGGGRGWLAWASWS